MHIFMGRNTGLESRAPSRRVALVGRILIVAHESPHLRRASTLHDHTQGPTGHALRCEQDRSEKDRLRGRGERGEGARQRERESEIKKALFVYISSAHPNLGVARGSCFLDRFFAFSYESASLSSHARPPWSRDRRCTASLSSLSIALTTSTPAACSRSHTSPLRSVDCSTLFLILCNLCSISAHV